MKRGLGTIAGAVAWAMVFAMITTSRAQAAQPHVVVATLDGVIDPITDTYVVKALDQAVNDRATAFILQLDTPGGLDTSMRDIIKHVLAAPVPVVVFVSPSGARAASAGLYITEAADVAAMAPGTNIGSAHPVSIGGSNPVPNASASPAAGTDIEAIKVENDAAAYIRALATLHHRNADWAEQAVRHSVNVPADEALHLNVVDLESRDLSSLLETLQGRQVVKGGKTYTMATANAAIRPVSLSDVERLLQALVDPNIAYLLLLLAMIGIGFWVTHPGLVLPGVVGVIAAFLAAITLFNLPTNLGGLLLILTAIVLFIVDIKATTHGVLTTGGVIAMVLGGLLLIDTGFLAEGVNVALLLMTVVLVGATFAFILRKVIAARMRPYAAGGETLVGRVATVRQPLTPSGMVFLDGALWQAISRSGDIELGAPVRVVEVRGLELLVEPLRQEAAPGRGPAPQPLPN
jgi:membrane-bound serine protease (ClpP class)